MFEQMYTDSGKLPVQALAQQMLDGMHSVLEKWKYSAEFRQRFIFSS